VPDLDTTKAVAVPNYIPPFVEAPGGKVYVLPSPFMYKTNIHFETKKPEKVKGEVMDLLGRKVAVLSNKHFEPGNHVIQWNGKTQNVTNRLNEIHRDYEVETNTYDIHTHVGIIPIFKFRIER